MDKTIIPSKAKVKNLIFMFHGYGSHKDDLYPIGERFVEAMPAAEIHLLNGIEPCNEGAGYRWFAMDSDNVNDWNISFEPHIKPIMDYVDSVKNSNNLRYEDVIFAGFSQGAMLSLSLGISHGIKAVISFSGMLLAPEKYLKRTSTKVLLAHGDRDNVIPISAMDLTKSALEHVGVSVETAISPGLSHSIDMTLLDKAAEFLKRL